MKRKAVRMWALWWPEVRYPYVVDSNRRCVELDRRAINSGRIVRVEVRPVTVKRKARKGKR